MTQVFLSHSIADAEFALRLATDLRSAGIPVWKAPESILDGEEWVPAIERGLTTSTHFLLLQSPAALNSKWVKFEFNCALTLVQHDKMRIIPIAYQPCAAPLFWTQFQQVTGIHDDYNAALLRIIARLREEPPIHPPEPTVPATTINVTIQGDLSGSLAVVAHDVVYEGQPLEPPSIDPEVHGELATVQQTTSAPAMLLPDASEVLSILPPPFEWCSIPPGFLKLERMPQRIPTFSVQPFWMAKYPITYSQFQAFLDADDGFHDRRWWHDLPVDADYYKGQPGEQEWKFDTHPRERVSWWDAIAFCQWLNTQLGLPPIPAGISEDRLSDYKGIRLPAEWEWQRAAQGLDTRDYPWGNWYQQGYANIDEISSEIEDGVCLNRTTPVDSYPQAVSPYGVLDMIGNVWEWCLNEHDVLERVVLAVNGERALRGGSWNDTLSHAHCSCRHCNIPYSRNHVIGFRVVCGAPSPPTVAVLD